MEWWNFWWLIFPLMGVAGGAAKAWERGARYRHERRLEIIKAKGQLKAAQASAKAVAHAPADTDVTESQQQQLERLFAAHDQTTRRWLDYELDVAKLIAFPAMSDGRQPLTAAFLRAKRVADGLRPASAKARLEPAELAEYRNAVTDYEVAFDVAERDARRLKDSSFTDAERKRLSTAKQLLTVAIDEAATPAERQVAYRRVREELDGLLSLSDEAIDVLEKKVSLELTTGPTTIAPTAPTARPEASTPPAAPPAPAATDAPRSPVPPREPKTGTWSAQRDGSTTAAGRVVRPKSTS